MKTNLAAKLSAAALIVLLIACAPSSAFAWGKDGHIIVAHLAMKLLTPKASAQVAAMLQPTNETLEAVSNWADEIRSRGGKPGRAETPMWHFVDIPLKGDYTAARDCAETSNGSCVVSALVMFQDVLTGFRKGYYKDEFNRYEALKFIVHFAGDIHQPLHCIDDRDRGGNDKSVKWTDGKTTNLHHVWDDDILFANMKAENKTDDAAYGDFLFGKLTAQEKNQANPLISVKPTAVSRKNIETWAKDSHKIADQAYADLGQPDENKFYHLEAGDGKYYKKYKNTVDQQLKLAGIRLARILNENLR